VAKRAGFLTACLDDDCRWGQTAGVSEPWDEGNPEGGLWVDYLADGHTVEPCKTCKTGLAEVIEADPELDAPGAPLIVREWHTASCTLAASLAATAKSANLPLPSRHV
jgi:hypothetical protein